MLMDTWFVYLMCLVLNGSMSEGEILGRADARIEKYRKGDLVIRLTGPDGKVVLTGREVKVEQTRHAFLFGCNIFHFGRCGKLEVNAAYERQFADLWNFATLPFYWYQVEPTEGKLDLAHNERLVQWCKSNGITPKGHTLAWSLAGPKWLSDDAAEAMRAQQQYIARCIRRFGGDIAIWDVVNEATQYDRPELAGNGPALTEAIRHVGVGAYVRSAFETAHRANPDAVLIINDYRTERDYEEKVIKELVHEDGEPLYDVVGIQLHQHEGAWSARRLWELCERFKQHGKPLHFTEVTLLSGKLGRDLGTSNPGFKWESTPEGERRQAREAGRLYTVLFSHPAVEAITWWDFTDLRSWQGAPSGLLRADMTPKPAYQALRNLIKGQWWTRMEIPVGDAGQVRFRGFFGRYRVTVSSGGESLTGTFSFNKTSCGRIDVQLR